MYNENEIFIYHQYILYFFQTLCKVMSNNLKVKEYIFIKFLLINYCS